MPDDRQKALDENRKLLDSLSRSPQKSTAPAAPSAAPAQRTAEPARAPARESTPAPRDPRDDSFLHWWGRRHPTTSVGGYGVAQGLAQFGSNVLGTLGTLSNNISPSLGQLAQRGRQPLQEFADEPSNSMLQSGGKAIGEYLPFYAAPGARLAEALRPAEEAEEVVPLFQRGAEWALQEAPRAGRFSRAARIARGAATDATTGAIGGAIGDPDNPTEGAIGGAVSGLAPGILSGTLRHPLGRLAASVIGVGALGDVVYNVTHSLGLSAGSAGAAASMIHWRRAPAPGAGLFRRGDQLFDGLGRLVGIIPPAAMGYFAGPTVGENANEIVPDAINTVRSLAE